MATRSKAMAWACAGLFCSAVAPGLANGQGVAPPDFSGVYYLDVPKPPPKPPTLGPDGKPALPSAVFAPVLDGSRGRPANAPPLNAEYSAKYDAIMKSRTEGSSETDGTARCLPPGMPYMMIMAYGMEVMQTKDKITFFSEWIDALRRVYLDGRKPTQKILDDPTYAGYSTGHWEGETLVVETVALRGDSPIDATGAPHSDAMTIHEEFRLVGPGLLEDQITLTDPKALTKPFQVRYRYKKAAPPYDELREFACAESLDTVK